MRTSKLIAALAFAAFATAALAGDFYEKDGVAIRGYDPVAYFTDGKLYLNYNAGVQKQWRADIPGFISKAERNWPQVAKQTKIIE